MNCQAVLGIELGSTRIKAVLADETAAVIAQGSFEWKNSLENGYWTYSLEDVRRGLQTAYKELNNDYKSKFGCDITELRAIGISAMMHGYLAFDGNDELLVPFRTWRNTTTARAADELTQKLGFNIPQRWSVAHYYQAVLDNEPHVAAVAYLTTLAGYVHYKLTGEKVIGIGDASGTFPVNGKTYDKKLLEKFNALIGKDFEKLLPKVLVAGERAGTLTEAGARFLDPAGNLKAGAVFCPPEGDAGTGMVATNSVSPKTANVSAGTSAFLMAVLEKPLEKVYKEIDIVTTPDGASVAMVHVNNCTSEINAWAELFAEAISLGGGKITKGELMTRLFEVSETADNNAGGLTAYNFLSGEPIAELAEGRPLTLRDSDGKLSLANFMKAQIYSAVAALRLGVEILEKEGVAPDCVCGHGGFFKTETVGQKVMAAALKAPVTVMRNAGEGGAWGIALLAAYVGVKGKNLQQFLDGIFSNCDKKTLAPDPAELKKLNEFMERYKRGLKVAKLASEVL